LNPIYPIAIRLIENWGMVVENWHGEERQPPVGGLARTSPRHKRDRPFIREPSHIDRTLTRDYPTAEYTIKKDDGRMG
jgi:hypothetical protein